MHLHIYPEYISAGCNNKQFEIDWGVNDIIAYGASNSVILQRPLRDAGTVSYSVNNIVLFGDKSEITSVRWVVNLNGDDELTAGSSDGNVFIWKRNKSFTFDRTATFKAHEFPVLSLDAVSVNSPYADLVIVTACVNGLVKIWKRNLSGKIICTDVEKFDPDFCTALRLIALPHLPSGLLLACGKNSDFLTFYAADAKDFEKNEVLFSTSYNLGNVHGNWISCIDFLRYEEDDYLFVAVGSFDGTIKVFRISLTSCENNSDIVLGTKYFTVIFETILTGHTGGIYGIRFCGGINAKKSEAKLVTAALDSLIMVYRVENWEFEACVGKIATDDVGFLGIALNPTGTSFISYDFQGNLYMWSQDSNNLNWLSQPVNGGHFDSVADVQWDPDGNFFISVGKDQTVSVHCPQRKYSDIYKRTLWAEFARPQLHGYDMLCVAVLPHCRFVSGSSEHILRSFTATKTFVSNCTKNSYLNSSPSDFPDSIVKLQPLNLSAVAETVSADETDEANAYKFGVPVSSFLPERTLWPETCKLYSHKNDISCLAGTSDGTLIASACEGNSENQCAIVIWNVSNWKEKQKLVSHTLTVNQLAFSPDNNSLLSVGRDRRWTVFKRVRRAVLPPGDNNDAEEFVKIDGTEDADAMHRRNLLCCAWSHDGKYFATGSRNGILIIWGSEQIPSDKDEVRFYEADNSQFPSTIKPISSSNSMANEINQRRLKKGRLFDPVAVFSFGKSDSVTAVSFAPDSVAARSNYFFAVGFGSGLIRYIFWQMDSSADITSEVTGKFYSQHSSAVNRLTFRPKFGKPGFQSEDNKTLLLASCGADHIIYLYNLHFSDEKIIDSDDVC